MRVHVKVMRQRGRNLPADQLKAMPPRSGELLVEQKRDPELSRNTLRARLIDDKSGNDILPELASAELVHAKENILRLTGLERIDQVDYAQTWSVEMA